VPDALYPKIVIRWVVSIRWKKHLPEEQKFALQQNKN